MVKKKAIIFGITGQDGSYLSRLLIKKNYNVFGVTRNRKKTNLKNLFKLKIRNKIKIIELKDYNQKKIYKLIKKISPKEIYYLAGESSVGYSFKDPITSYMSNNEVLFYILETARMLKKKFKVYNSTSSECFGNRKDYKCNEKTNFNPVSPYGRSKSFSFWLSKYYRDNYNVKISNGILFNHESPLRNTNFVTQKIISFAKKFKGKKDEILSIGNIKIMRDWGWANDYVDAIHKITSHKIDDDYVIGTGQSFSLKEFIKIIFKEKKIPITRIKVLKKFFRPFEIYNIVADNRKIRQKLKWTPKIKFKEMAIKLLRNEIL